MAGKQAKDSGSVFRLIEAHAWWCTAGAIVNTMEQRPLRILLVEDERDVAEMYKVRLELDGLAVKVASTGAKALILIGSERPDLVLLDVLLPHGGGFKVLEFIRSQPKLSSLRVIVLSGSNAPGVLEQASAMGANSVLLKPGAFRDLVNLAASLHATWSTARRLSPESSPPGDVIHLTAR